MPSAEASTPFLELTSVSREFGGVIAVNDLSMTIAKGSIHGLIGPNGSGKSTTFNLIAGEIPLSSGHIHFKGRRISGLPPHRMADLGIARTFQATDLFEEFTVTENLTVAANLRWRCSYWSTLFATPRYRLAGREIAETVDALIGRLRLAEVRDTKVSDLAHRHQKAVALGNALAAAPEILMLDEPAAGLTHQEMEEMMSTYRVLQSEGLTILLVEHNMRAVMGLCSSITVLNQGRKIAEGTPAEVAGNAEVIEAYLGKGGDRTRQ